MGAAIAAPAEDAASPCVNAPNGQSGRTDKTVLVTNAAWRAPREIDTLRIDRIGFAPSCSIFERSKPAYALSFTQFCRDSQSSRDASTTVAATQASIARTQSLAHCAPWTRGRPLANRRSLAQPFNAPERLAVQVAT